jgi:hypothetical protein
MAICETGYRGNHAKTSVKCFSGYHQPLLSFQNVDGLIFPNPKTGFSF